GWEATHRERDSSGRRCGTVRGSPPPSRMSPDASRRSRSAAPTIPAPKRRRRRRTRQVLRPVSSCQRGADRVQQGFFAERLDQAPYGPAREQGAKDGGVSVRRDEHDWDLLPAPGQLLLELGARHPWHRDVEKKSARLGDEFRREKRFGGCKRLRGKAELPQQVRQRLADGLVVVYNRHQGRLGDHECLIVVFCHALRLTGIENKKVAPGPSFGSAQRRP